MLFRLQIDLFCQTTLLNFRFIASRKINHHICVMHFVALRKKIV